MGKVCLKKTAKPVYFPNQKDKRGKGLNIKLTARRKDKERGKKVKDNGPLSVYVKPELSLSPYIQPEQIFGVGILGERSVGLGLRTQM